MFNLICKEEKYTAAPGWDYADILHAYDKEEVGRLKRNGDKCSKISQVGSCEEKKDKDKELKKQHVEKSKKHQAVQIR